MITFAILLFAVFLIAASLSRLGKPLTANLRNVATIALAAAIAITAAVLIQYVNSPPAGIRRYLPVHRPEE